MKKKKLMWKFSRWRNVNLLTILSNCFSKFEKILSRFWSTKTTTKKRNYTRKTWNRRKKREKRKKRKKMFFSKKCLIKKFKSKTKKKNFIWVLKSKNKYNYNKIWQIRNLIHFDDLNFGLLNDLLWRWRNNDLILNEFRFVNKFIKI